MVVLNFIFCCNKYFATQDVRDAPTNGLEMFVWICVQNFRKTPRKILCWISWKSVSFRVLTRR